jgi:2-phospho-L-lactate guanylyltransferase
MLAHVVGIVRAAGLRTIALSPHPVQLHDVETWRDEGVGLNRAVRAALERIGTPVLVVHADLPWLGIEDIETVLASPADVVIARAHDGGTNGLLLRRLITPAFGPVSAVAHATRARGLGLTAHVLDVPGFARDLDDASALSAYAAVSSPGKRL